jgi:hypothetical protein
MKPVEVAHDLLERRRHGVSRCACGVLIDQAADLVNEILDAAAVSDSHHLIAPQEMLILRLLASWLHQVALAFGLPRASPTGLWNALLSGQRAGFRVPVTCGDPHNERELIELTQLSEVRVQFGELVQRAITAAAPAGRGTRPPRAMPGHSLSFAKACGSSRACSVEIAGLNRVA